MSMSHGASTSLPGADSHGGRATVWRQGPDCRHLRLGSRDLASDGPGQHRVPLADALIAAAAQDAGVEVLHYDHHYDRLAQVLNFESVWIASPGTLERQKTS